MHTLLVVKAEGEREEWTGKGNEEMKPGFILCVGGGGGRGGALGPAEQRSEIKEHYM